MDCCICLTFLMSDETVAKEEEEDKEACAVAEKTEFVALLFYVHGKHLRSCRDGQLT